jgi:hypothetical protein
VSNYSTLDVINSDDTVLRRAVSWFVLDFLVDCRTLANHLVLVSS